MSTHNICYGVEIRKTIIKSHFLSKVLKTFVRECQILHYPFLQHINKLHLKIVKQT